MPPQMPSERPNPLEDTPENIHVRHAAEVLDEIEAHAANSALLQATVVVVGESLIDNGNPAITAAARSNRIEHRAVIGAMTARLNNYGSLNTERFMQGRQALLGSIRRCIGAIGRVRKFR